MSRSAQPKRECHHAMSSVCTTAELVTASCSRAASVVFPLELRPSTAQHYTLAARSSPATKLEQALNNHRQRYGTPWSAFGLLGSELDCHDYGLPSQWFSRASVTHCPPVLLPGLPACPPSTSSKIIPCISREGSEQEPDRRPALCRSPSASSDRPLHFCPSGGSSGAGSLLPWSSPWPWSPKRYRPGESRPQCVAT
jgi:hypothetical protein